MDPSGLLYIILLVTCVIGVAHTLERFGRLLPTAVYPLLVVLSELFKKASYILLADELGRLISYVVVAPLIYVGISLVRSHEAPLVWLESRASLSFFMCWMLLLVFSTLAGSQTASLDGVVLTLGALLLYLLPTRQDAHDYGRVKQVYLALLAVSAAVATIGLVGLDPLWRLYAQAAAPYTIGARYTSDSGYAGSLFASPTDFGQFLLAAMAIACGPDIQRRQVASRTSVRRNATVCTLGVLAAAASGSRFVLVGAILFSTLIIFYRRKLPVTHALVVLLSCAIGIEFMASRLLANEYVVQYAYQQESTLLRRATNVGTLNSRIGAIEAVTQAARQHPVLGLGAVDYTRAEDYDDRHHSIVRSIMQAGLIGALCLIVGTLIRLKQLADNGGAGRSAVAYVVAAMVVSLGGPTFVTPWFFLVLAGCGLSLDSAKLEPLRAYPSR